MPKLPKPGYGSYCQNAKPPLGGGIGIGSKGNTPTAKSPTGELRYYHVQTPELSMTVIGGGLIEDGEHVWLTGFDGQKMLRVRRDEVKPSSAEELAQRIQEDVKNVAAAVAENWRRN